MSSSISGQSCRLVGVAQPLDLALDAAGRKVSISSIALRLTREAASGSSCFTHTGVGKRFKIFMVPSLECRPTVLAFVMTEVCPRCKASVFLRAPAIRAQWPEEHHRPGPGDRTIGQGKGIRISRQGDPNGSGHLGPRQWSCSAIAIPWHGARPLPHKRSFQYPGSSNGTASIMSA